MEIFQTLYFVFSVVTHGKRTGNQNTMRRIKMKQSKFHRDIDPLYDLWKISKRNPNYWVLKHINESEHEVLHLVYTKTDVEENSGVNHERKTPRKFTDKEWDDIVGTFNNVEFDHVWDLIEECVEEALKHKGESDDKET
jgi:hypothetical protein